MAIGPGMYKEEYKNYSKNELIKALDDAQKYLNSNELKEAEKEELENEIDDNNCISNVETEIQVLRELIANYEFKSSHLKNIAQECIHSWVMINKTPGIGKVWELFPNGEKREVYYDIYKCSKCGLEKEMSEHDAKVNFEENVITKIIRNIVGTNDVFWQQTLEKYFNSLKGIKIGEKIAFVEKLTNKKEIFNEFTKEIIQNNNEEELFIKYSNLLNNEKYKINDEFNNPLKTIVQECIGNDDPYWNIPVCKLVEKIMKLKDGDETSIVELIGDSNYTSKQLFDISKCTFKVCDKLHIKLDFSKHEGKSEVLPYNLTFIKRQLLCPKCNNRLQKMMPDGKILFCNKCEKCYTNDNENVGSETSLPDNDKNILY